MRVFKDRYIVVGLGVMVACLTFVAVAFAVSSNTHTTNGVGHGLSDFLAGNEYVPLGWTDPPGSQHSTADVRHYFPDGSFNVQCTSENFGYTQCGGTWGSLPCHKRYVGGTDTLMSRHWMRANGCSGQLHA